VRFEDAGRAIDKEVAKLVQHVNKNVRPKTRQEAAALLRRASRELAKLARNLEKAER
jgi:hypothetical protein